MPENRTPGVRIEHVLTEPARVLRTGVPVFLGMVSNTAVEAWNRDQDEPEDRFLCRPLPESEGPAIVRKRSYVRLPSRTSDPVAESQISDRWSSDVTMYLRSMPLTPQSGNVQESVKRSGGAAGPGLDLTAPEGELVRAISVKPQRFTVWPQFQQTYRGLASAGFLFYAVHGFFENGGALCYVQLVAYPETSHESHASPGMEEALAAGLKNLAQYDDYDIVCVPDLMWEPAIRNDIPRIAALQNRILEHCAVLGDRMAILDAAGGEEISAADIQAQRELLDDVVGVEGSLVNSDDIGSRREVSQGKHGALYYPWVRIPGGPEQTAGYVPPCGHVAGIYARTDERVGVHKAPANEIVEGVVGLADNLNDESQGPLNELGINCLRAFPRRGIRVWGARTLTRGTAWRYVNVWRVVQTAARWINLNMSDVAFEPHTPRLWGRITRELTAYLGDLARRGALVGPPNEEAFFVKCDAETNPAQVRETGHVVTLIGLRPATPSEFIVIRIIHGPAGVEIVSPQPQTAEPRPQA